MEIAVVEMTMNVDPENVFRWSGCVTEDQIAGIEVMNITAYEHEGVCLLRFVVLCATVASCLGSFLVTPNMMSCRCAMYLYWV